MSSFSTPSESPATTPPSSPRPVLADFVGSSGPRDTPFKSGVIVSHLLRQQFRGWSVGFKALSYVSTSKPPSPNKDSLKPKKAATPKSPKPMDEVHECQAVSWYDPASATWEPHSDPLLPLDRRRCGKKATTKVTVNGEEIWCCGTHAKATPETCSTCAKNKHIDFDGSHGHSLLKRGYLSRSNKDSGGELVYVEGECQGLLREGEAKLAKKGHQRWAK